MNRWNERYGPCEPDCPCNLSYVTIAPPGMGGHTPEFAEAARSPWGDQAFLRSAQAIAMAAVDLMTQPNHLAQEKADFKTIMDDRDAAWRQQRFFR